MDAATAKYESETVATRIDGQDVTIATLRNVFEKVENPSHWKRPWAAAVPAAIVSLVSAAVEFYHADRPEIVGTNPVTGHVLMRGRGYQA